jgi:hypothetical protein
MLSNGKAHPNESKDAAGSPRPNPEMPGSKDGMRAASPPGSSGRTASATSADDVVAKEALEGIKRIRAKARMDKMAITKSVAAPLRPAVIVAKPPPPRPTWVAPLATLAVAIGLVISACTGFIAYLAMQPGQTSSVSSAEIRNLRETVAQLRRQVTGVSENLDGLRTAVDFSSKATNDRFGRFAENLDRIERVSSSSTAKLDRLAEAQVAVRAPAAPEPQSQPQPPQPLPVLASAVPAEVTGSVSAVERPSPLRKLVKGWSVRQAYEGIAILQGPAGVVEVILGQQVPGLGRIEEIRSDNGHAVVLTSAGAISSAHKAAP